MLKNLFIWIVLDIYPLPPQLGTLQVVGSKPFTYLFVISFQKHVFHFLAPENRKKVVEIQDFSEKRWFSEKIQFHLPN